MVTVMTMMIMMMIVAVMISGVYECGLCSVAAVRHDDVGYGMFFVLSE